MSRLVPGRGTPPSLAVLLHRGVAWQHVDDLLPLRLKLPVNVVVLVVARLAEHVDLIDPADAGLFLLGLLPGLERVDCPAGVHVLGILDVLAARTVATLAADV